jgi:hypothetical protein
MMRDWRRPEPLAAGIRPQRHAMSMFDYYRPANALHCPICQRLLVESQGKDPNGLFVWVEGTAHPVDQMAGDDVALDPKARERFSLPRSFTIYSYDCPDHWPIDAVCRASDGVWNETAIRSWVARNGD